MTGIRTITVVCEKGRHVACYKGRPPTGKTAPMAWCECPCHPFREEYVRFSPAQLLRKWLSR